MPGWCQEVEVVEKADVDRWLQAYVEAWKSYDGEVYDNCFVMRFDAAGRCREFTEWYVRRPRG